MSIAQGFEPYEIQLKLTTAQPVRPTGKLLLEHSVPGQLEPEVQIASLYQNLARSYFATY